MTQKIFKLRGKVQHYPWGGYEFIPSLLGFENPGNKPCAEYWLGAHPTASSELETEKGPERFYDLIQQQPVLHLGEQVYKRFGELPYLFKVLDVKDMLSIQVHPTIEGAKKGFEKEEASGVAIDANGRNYKDRNHKPEVMIALGEFWLLHGFKRKEELHRVLESTVEFNFLGKIFSEGGYHALYKTVMEMGSKEVDNLLFPLVKKELAVGRAKSEPGYWVSTLYNRKMPAENIDRGIFSIYFFNIVHLKEGEAIFQAAGVPHAYLEGQNVELMANSDNVLRGGLTSKHVDVPELLKHIVFTGIDPQILRGEHSGHETGYKLPVDDFSISVIKLGTGDNYVSSSKSAEIFLVFTGKINAGELSCKRGEAFVILPVTRYAIHAIDDAVLYKAFVPL